MNHSPAKILAEILVLGVAPYFTALEDGGAWPIYISSMPDGLGTSDNCAAIYDTAGEKEVRLLSGVSWFKYGFQIRIRSLVYLLGWVKAKAVLAFLGTVHNEAVVIEDDTYTIESIILTSPVFSLGAEPGTRRREIFTLNGLVRFLGGDL